MLEIENIILSVSKLIMPLIQYGKWGQIRPNNSTISTQEGQQIDQIFNKVHHCWNGTDQLTITSIVDNEPLEGCLRSVVKDAILLLYLTSREDRPLLVQHNLEGIMEGMIVKGRVDAVLKRQDIPFVREIKGYAAPPFGYWIADGLQVTLYSMLAERIFGLDDLGIQYGEILYVFTPRLVPIDTQLYRQHIQQYLPKVLNQYRT